MNVETRCRRLDFLILTEVLSIDEALAFGRMLISLIICALPSSSTKLGKLRSIRSALTEEFS